MTNKLAVITGATSGIGAVCASAIAAAGYDLILPCRNVVKGDAIKSSIRASHPDSNIEVLDCQFDSLASVRDCAQAIANRHQSIDLLINNAGYAPLKVQLSSDGIEKSFAVNHLSHFVLTLHLIDALKANGGARIVHTSSEAAYGGGTSFLDDLNYENHKFKFFKAYSNTKLANLWFSNKLARDLESDGIISNAFHPGRVATGIWPSKHWYQRLITAPLKKFYLISPEQGAKPMIDLALNESLAGKTGRFWFEMEEREQPEKALNEACQAKLWKVSERLCAEFL